MMILMMTKGDWLVHARLLSLVLSDWCDGSALVREREGGKRGRGREIIIHVGHGVYWILRM